MDAAGLHLLMEDTTLLSHDTLQGLRQLVEDYPYFHTARILYLKNLAVLNDVQFGTELKKTAIYVHDRKMLYMLIEQVRLIFEEHSPEQMQATEDPFDIIDVFLKGKSGADPDPGIIFRQPVSQEYVIPIFEGSGLSENVDTMPLQHEDLINDYLRENEISHAHRWKDEEDDTEYATPDSITSLQKNDDPKSPNDSYFTETLARIYIKQKRYEKALEIIRNLSLKYPEKNIYFADQIRFLEKLIINVKKYT
ncbi:MAG: hypothetical protein LBJ39_03600 [Tannerellaceae bacterium]|jgi:hypothetical protein|nr:hypothetical protein [Tannerellaceae bacterium]